MPKSIALVWPKDKQALFDLGMLRMSQWCKLNSFSIPPVKSMDSEAWHFPSVCAFYRPDIGIEICLDHCGFPCPEAKSRNWTWPGSTTDREPYGVITHELGHHVDFHMGFKKGSYGSDYSGAMRKATGEEPISGYCDNDWEWFAEMFRVFVTNPALLRQLRPKTYTLMCKDFKPLGDQTDWKQELRTNVPGRVVRSLRNKGARG